MYQVYDRDISHTPIPAAVRVAWLGSSTQQKKQLQHVATPHQPAIAIAIRKPRGARVEAHYLFSEAPHLRSPLPYLKQPDGGKYKFNPMNHPIA